MRPATALWTVFAVATAVTIFVVKQNVKELEEELHGVHAEIATEREAIAVLDAEWTHLNQPSRLEDLGRRLLGLDAPRSGQIRTIEAFLAGAEPKRREAPARAPTVAAQPVSGSSP